MTCRLQNKTIPMTINKNNITSDGDEEDVWVVGVVGVVSQGPVQKSV